MGNNKRTANHLTLQDRVTIEVGLNKCESFRTIANKINKTHTTVSREVQNRKIYKRKGCFGSCFNECKHRFDCQIINLCNNDKCKNKRCKTCKLCNKLCGNFEKESCNRLLNGALLCNGCDKLHKCTLLKIVYDAKEAQKEYEYLLKDIREGANLTKEELKRLNSIITDGINKGHSFYAILENNKDSLMTSLSTLYRYLELGYLDVKNIDLPMKVKMKPRKKYKTYKVDKKCKVNRTYKDFNIFLDKNPDVNVVEMDLVEGKKGGKNLLTFGFRDSHLLLAYLIDDKSSKSVIDVINKLYDDLGRTLFKKVFEVILTDNGSEFSNPLAIELDNNANRRTNIFYCDPYSSYQKGTLENLHKEIRKILPKGSSFDDLTQDKVNIMINNINSYPRKIIGGMTPYTMFKRTKKIGAVKKLKLAPINPKKILLKPKLLK